MKLAAIATILALTGTDAIYYECCKTSSEKCPNVMTFKDGMEAGVMGETFKMCCQPDLAPEKVPDQANLGKTSTCIDDIDAGNGMSISVMAFGLPAPEQTTTSSVGTCCEIDAVVQPGKLRSSTSSSCPVNMYSMADANGPNSNPLCCNHEGTTLDDTTLEDVGACSAMAVTIANTSGGNDSVENDNELQEGESTENQEDETVVPGEDQEGELAQANGEEGEPADNATPKDEDSTDNIADSQQALGASNGASAASAAFVVALLGAAIQVAL